ncbi:MAG: glycosyltransferase, partial [Thermoanaerobaculia bacterium]|nr:glycosyltransferase [Thermoanaerobaculia bacterium]
MTLVSVVVPTRDRRAALERALASVDAQTHAEVELLVVDDGSRDETASWLARARPAARVLAGGGRGAGGARNRGLEAAQGELVAFLDDDDRWRPSYLATQVAWLAARPDVDLAYADHVEVDAAGRVGAPDLRPLAGYDSELIALLAEGGIHTMSVVVCRRSAYVRWGGFDESLRVVQDLEWYARLLAGGARLARLPQA